MTESKPLVLFVDDLRDIRELLEAWWALGKLPFEPIFAHSQDEALRLVHDHPALVAAVLDVNLMGENGASVAEVLHQHYPHIHKAFLTAYDRPVTQEHAEEFQMDVISKPIAIQDLIECVMSLVREGKANCDQAKRDHRRLRADTKPPTMPPVLREITKMVF